MSKPLRFAFAFLLCSAATLSAWPFPPLPQCGPIPSCSTEACYVPPSEKCAQVAADCVDGGDCSTCSGGVDGGVCLN